MTMQLNASFQMGAETRDAIRVDLDTTIQGALKNLKQAQRLNDARYARWRDIAAQPAPVAAPVANADSAPIAGMLLATLLDGLFGGLPIFQAFGGLLGDGLAGAAGLGAMAAIDDTAGTQDIRRSAGLNTALKAAQAAKYRNASASQQAQMQMLQEMAALLVLNVLSTQNQGDKESGKGEEGLVPDVLRHPKMARFKQNRHSISCIRTLFQRETEMTTPHFAAPAYRM